MVLTIAEVIEMQEAGTLPIVFSMRSMDMLELIERGVMIDCHECDAPFVPVPKTDRICRKCRSPFIKALNRPDVNPPIPLAA